MMQQSLFGESQPKQNSLSPETMQFLTAKKVKAKPEYQQVYVWQANEYQIVCHESLIDRVNLAHKQAESFILKVSKANIPPKDKDELYERLFKFKDYEKKPKEIESKEPIRKYILEFRRKFNSDKLFFMDCICEMLIV